MYLSTSTEDFPEMYLSTFQVLYKLYLSTDVLKYKVLMPGSGWQPFWFAYAIALRPTSTAADIDVILNIPQGAAPQGACQGKMQGTGR